MLQTGGHSCLVRGPRKFGTGYTGLVKEKRHPLTSTVQELMDFGVLRLRRGERQVTRATKESLWVLLQGRVELRSSLGRAVARRESIFDEAPTALHVGPGETVELRALSALTECAVVAASGSRMRGVRIYRPEEIGNEDRGAGLAQDACRRTVRTIFDHASRPDSQLVVGEVVNRAGRWSSYPPHHHPQPEVYHYRFTEPQGYGHAELGDEVVKVRQADTTLIPGGLDHAQVAAPGYGMYYLWVVRHLPRRPYRGFTFTPEHRWLLDPRRQGWAPR